MRALSALLVLVIAGPLGGCAYSTEYVPEREGYVALTMKEGELRLRKGRKEIAAKEAELGAFGRQRSRPGDIFECSAPALDEYLAAQEHFELAQLFHWGGLGVLLVGALVFPSLAVLGWGSWALLWISGEQSGLGLARLVDAMNVHNDAVACTGEQVVVGGDYEEAGGEETRREEKEGEEAEGEEAEVPERPVPAEPEAPAPPQDPAEAEEPAVPEVPPDAPPDLSEGETP